MGRPLSAKRLDKMDLTVQVFGGESKKLYKQVGYNKYTLENDESSIVKLVDELTQSGEALLTLEDGDDEYPVIKVVDNVFQTTAGAYDYTLNDSGKVVFSKSGVKISDPDFPQGTETHEIKTTDTNVTSEDAVILNGTVTQKLTVTAPSVKLDSVALNADKRVIVKSEDVTTLNGVTATGTFNKANGNTVMSVDGCSKIIIKDMVFDDTFKGYNALEIGNDTAKTNLPDEVTIENCTFKGTLSNNAINIFGTKDNAIITIKNCTFEKVSNLVRISNRANKSGVKVIIKDCTCTSWETGEYAGIFLMQDYTSTSASAVATNNLFAPAKLTLELDNVTGPYGLVSAPAKLSEIMCSHNNNQLAYLYADKGGLIAYDSSKVPTFIINGVEITRD